jgi:hypothetical protein
LLRGPVSAAEVIAGSADRAEIVVRDLSARKRRLFGALHGEVGDGQDDFESLPKDELAR